jgi:hypothetical protein
VLALVVMGAAAFFLLRGGRKPASAASQDPPAPASKPAEQHASPPSGPGAVSASPTSTPGQADVPEPPAQEKEPTPILDLAALPDFGPAPGTTPEQWLELQSSAARFFDLDQGAAGMRAGMLLEQTGRAAVPAILNEMKRIDLTTPDGLRCGDMAQKALERIALGRNYGWKYEGTEGAVEYDRRVIEKWISTWKQCAEDVEAWIRFTNMTEKDPEAAAKLRQELGSAPAGDAPAEDLDPD